MGVVDELEEIDVEEGQAEGFATALLSPELAVQQVEHVPTVGHVGQAVSGGEVLELLQRHFELVALGCAALVDAVNLAAYKTRNGQEQAGHGEVHDFKPQHDGVRAPPPQAQQRGQHQADGQQRGAQDLALVQPPHVKRQHATQQLQRGASDDRDQGIRQGHGAHVDEHPHEGEVGVGLALAPAAAHQGIDRAPSHEEEAAQRDGNPSGHHAE